MCGTGIDLFGPTSPNYTQESPQMGTIKSDISEFPAKSSETWFIRGQPYIIEGSGYAYFDTNGNPETKYITMHALDGTPYIITERAFVDKAVREEPIVPRWVTPDQILRLSPCVEGAKTLFSILKIKFNGNEYVDGANLAESGKRSISYSTQRLYDECRFMGVGVPDSWLLFVAKALNLVPLGSVGPDRKTLLRLLGIKE